MSGLEDVLGAGEGVKQLFLWGVLNQVIAALAAPYFQALANKVQADHPEVPLSAADAAHAVVRSYLSDGDGTAAAAKSGINPATFKIMQDLAGDAPSPEQLVEALRRGVIERDGQGAGSTSFTQGIRETNLLDKWTPVVEALAKQWPTATLATNAALKGQLSIDEAKATYAKLGGDPQWFEMVYNTEGNAPTPEEAVQMALRGIIAWDGTGADAVSYEQAFLEGPWRNKWAPAFKASVSWYPTEGEIGDLLRYGQITRGRAAELLGHRGITGGDAAAVMGYYDANAVDDYRGLTEQSVLNMVAAGYMSDAQAETMLTAVHKGPAAVKQLIAYAHLQRAITSLDRAVTRIGNLYQGRKIDRSTAHDALTGLHLPAAEIGDILADWETVASVNVKTLTEAQIADAHAAAIMTQAEAVQELVNIGYTPFDAWVLLSNKAKKPLPGKPAKGPGPPLGAVTPGTT